MKFKLSAADLTGALRHVMGIVPRSSAMPVLSHLLLKVDNSVLTITAYDMQVQLRATVPVSNAEDGAAVVAADKLYKLVGSVRDVDVTLETKKEKMELRFGRNRYKFSTLEPKEFPSIETIGATTDVTLPAADLSGLLDTVAYAMATNDVRYYLNGMLFECGDGVVTCVGTNGHRLAVASMSIPAMKAMPQAIIPRDAVAEMQKIARATEGEVIVRVAEKHAQVQGDGVVLTTSLVDGKYPDYRAVIPQTSDFAAEFDQPEILSAVRRVAILSDGRLRAVRLGFDNDHVELSTSDEARDGAKEILTFDGHTDDVPIGLSADYLGEALAAVGDGRVRLAFTNGVAACVVTGCGTSNAKHVLMPLRL